MGTWGYKPFENDDACDWIYDLEDSQDLALLEETIAEACADDYLEAPEASMAVAAAEVIAALSGKAGALPDEVLNWVKDRPPAPAALRARAVKALKRILTDSELKELWEENEDDFPEWQASLSDLLLRLD